ncbi:MAG: endolytic transglycosylase MltG [Lachnospiraceae bacterium]
MRNVQSIKYILLMLKRSLYIVINILVIIVVVYSTFYLCLQGYNFCYGIYGPVVVEEAPGQDIVFEVRDGDSMADVSKRLMDEGIISDKYAFYIRTKLMDTDKTILKAGVYTLNTSMDYGTIINQITFKE